MKGLITMVCQGDGVRGGSDEVLVGVWITVVGTYRTGGAAGGVEAPWVRLGACVLAAAL